MARRLELAALRPRTEVEHLPSRPGHEGHRRRRQPRRTPRARWRPTTLTYKRGTAAPTIVVDYGRETGGLPFFDLISSSGAPTLRSAYAEALRLLTKNGDGNVSSAGLFQGGNGNRYDTFGTSASGVVRSQYIAGGERYELITLDTPGTVKIASAGIKTTFERGTAKTLRGHFVSSDPLLNRIWYQSVYTLNLDQVPPGVTGGFPGESNPDHLILDGAKRDRAVWSGDLASPAWPTSTPATRPTSRIRWR